MGKIKIIIGIVIIVICFISVVRNPNQSLMDTLWKKGVTGEKKDSEPPEEQ